MVSGPTVDGDCLTGYTLASSSVVCPNEAPPTRPSDTVGKFTETFRHLFQGVGKAQPDRIFRHTHHSVTWRSLPALSASVARCRDFPDRIIRHSSRSRSGAFRLCPAAVSEIPTLVRSVGRDAPRALGGNITTLENKLLAGIRTRDCPALSFGTSYLIPRHGWYHTGVAL